MATSRFFRPVLSTLTGLGLVASLAVMATTSASAATVIDGPINLGTAATYGVLGASEVTNTGPTVINGDLGLSPGTSITGFGAAPDGVVNGTVHQTDAAATQAQQDTTTAYNVAASLTPAQTGLTELNGLSLTPGVYSGGALELAGAGALTLAGDAESVWVFQAASTLTIGSGSRIIITGGASSCNVFWQVGSSATLGTAAEFQGTILAQESITVTTAATVVGRLLARVGAVTLDTNTITASSGCPTPGTPSETVAPIITSGAAPSATAGQPYSYTVTATGTPSPTFTASGLPQGLSLDGATGVVSGTPATPGTSQVTITASNATAPDATTVVTINVASPTPVVTPSPTAEPSPTGPAAPTSDPTLDAPALTTDRLAATGGTPTILVGIAATALAAGLGGIFLLRRRARADA